ncbi:LAME_0E02014g1_1 [Lachancea meyersii CBS 8951]|uniref:LAME_0E02014g1_1 n=1 Tax=Lachancea meyersii CBS 8951 TaxID=1266667 RepID=A0A1G4JFF5_9SACH|nr:LAME_0E02014g1_1 [Lachancea meyersii CBS 8951]
MTAKGSPVCRTCSLKGGEKVWYREAGSKSESTILLLHGYPTSSNMFRNLIPLLASKFHVIAPDLPGFGFTTVKDDYSYTFENLSKTIYDFVASVGISKYILYIFDYGSPVGLRLALKSPTSVVGLIVQNGNAYEEGLDDRFWAPLKEYWKKDQDDQHYVETLKAFVEDPENIRCQYYDGVSRPEIVDPSGYILDTALFERRNESEIQVELFHDYQKNVALYPQFQEFLRSRNIPVLVVWGKNDIIFTCAGAEAYTRDATNVTLKFYDTGHFALETHCAEIADEIIDVFGAK